MMSLPNHMWLRLAFIKASFIKSAVSRLLELVIKKFIDTIELLLAIVDMGKSCDDTPESHTSLDHLFLTPPTHYYSIFACQFKNIN